MSDPTGPARYLAVAGTAAASDWLVFLLMTGLGSDAVLAQGVARLVGGAVAFVLHKFWAFEAGTTHRTVEEARRFSMLYVASYALSLSLLRVALPMLPTWWAKLLADSSCLVFNFVVMRLWVFAAGGDTPEA